MKTIICADALTWLQSNRNQGSVITSLPDADEIGISDDLSIYSAWFTNAARECFLSASENCPVIFVQGDRKKGGRWFSKACLLNTVAASLGWFLVWHKIELRQEVGKTNLYRPSYRHVLCFGHGTVSAGQATADVIPVSRTLYPMAFGMAAAEVACAFALKYNSRILDPFCGYGTVPYVASNLGAEAIGIDIDEAACARARQLL